MSSTIRIDTLPHSATGAHEIVELPMTALDRRRVRRRLTLDDGTVLELALPTGSVLPVGQPLHVDGERAIVVTAAEETVVVVRPRDLVEAARAGHLIGNLHRDVDITADGQVIALWDEPLEERLRAAGWDVEVAQRPFGGRAAGEHAH